MKVVLFCGGFGMRIREFSEDVPKPMVPIGFRPILWHLMKYYAHYGHKDFILCLGYKGNVIKDYFLNYNECLSNDFVLINGGKEIKLLNRDTDDWNITFVDTGLHSNIGQRLMRAQKYLEGEDVFLANYSDGLTDLPLSSYIDNFLRIKKTASILAVKPNMVYHVVSMNDENKVTEIKYLSQSGIWLNGGFYIFTKKVFQFMNEGEELVEQPFQRLIEKEELSTYKYEGFWGAMDTFKDKQYFEDRFSKGDAPWEVWK